MSERKRLSTRARAEIFQSAGGRCSLCGGRIQAGEAWDVEHAIPLAMGGADAPENMAPAHRKCHGRKTAADAGAIAQAKRREARHIGSRAPSRHPLPGGRSSPWRKKINGQVERRT